MPRTVDRVRLILWSHLIVAILVAGGAFGGMVVMRRAARRSEDLTAHALESIDAVEQMQSEVLDLQGASVQFLASDSPSERAQSLSEIVQLRRSIAESVARYRPLVQYPGELDAWLEFQDRYRQYCNALDEASRPADHHSRSALLERWDEVGSAARRLRTTADQLIAINMRANHRITARAAITYDRALLAMLLLLGAALSVGTVAALGMVRIVRRQARTIDEQYARIEERNADLDAFAGRIAHDLHGAMTPVLLLSQMLGRSGEQLGRRIERAVKRQSALVDELLLFSRASVKAGGCALVATAAASATASVPDGARLVTCRVPDELAARIALPLLESVLSNLLSNAAKYVGDQPDPRVIIEARRDGDRVVIEVQDNGVGMEPAVAAHIFEPFYRAPGRSEPGLGLGLATVHRIVEAHDGCVRVRSRPGEGTTFEVELPAA